MDLLEQTRMEDAYKDITNIIDQIGKLPVFPPLVWVWVWDNIICEIQNFQEDAEYQVNYTEKEIFTKFWEDADKNGFTLEYGTEDLYEHVRDWMIDSDIVTMVLDEDGESVVDSTTEEE